MNIVITTSKSIALISFVIGTSLFISQLYFADSIALVYLGIIFIGVAAIINTISIGILIFHLLGDNNQKMELAKTCGLVLLNIPIAILYFYILIETL